MLFLLPVADVENLGLQKFHLFGGKHHRLVFCWEQRRKNIYIYIYIYSSALRESLLDPPITSGWILYFWMLLLDLQSPILTDLQESRYFYLSIFAVALFIFVLVQSLKKLFAFGMRVWPPNTKPQVLGCRGGIYNKTTTLKACKKVAETNHLSWGGDGDGCIWPWDFFWHHVTILF